MTTSSYFLLVALGLLLYVCRSSFGSEHTCESDASPHPQGVCGSPLAEAVEAACELEQSLQGGTGKKRGRASLLRKRRAFLSMLKARAKRNEASPLQRSGRGIVCECCKNHCNIEELTEYCPPVTEGSG
uniref:Con-Ins F2c n=1 Tax=Conus floridulus TaxID=97180 RepID=INS2C_CONFO|nr:RecName: Full=Con-Ins F2c; AltName: Full=Insulin 2c; Contains: RecName: Full=Con-Ins F2c B chain; Contains: RecName: Full=Con-Ins F2c A chain; Flags: Precursor [Conus floridulus]AJD85829.1 insulin 2c precursor [Conus floridulus]